MDQFTNLIIQLEGQIDKLKRVKFMHPNLLGPASSIYLQTSGAGPHVLISPTDTYEVADLKRMAKASKLPWKRSATGCAVAWETDVNGVHITLMAMEKVADVAGVVFEEDDEDANEESPEDRMNREQAERQDEAYENHVNKELGVQ